MDIEKIIRENKEAFDSSEPTSGHFDRFREKIVAQPVQRRRILPIFLKAAAIALLVGLSTLWVLEHTVFKEKGLANQNTNTTNVIEDFNEARIYYTSQIDNKYAELNSLSSSDSLEQSIMFSELKEMDSIFNALQDESRLKPNDERLITAMLQHYQIKVKVLNRIITLLKNVEPTNTTSHEKVEI